MLSFSFSWQKGQLEAGMLGGGGGDRSEAMNLKVFGPAGTSWDCAACDCRNHICSSGDLGGTHIPHPGDQQLLCVVNKGRRERGHRIPLCPVSRVWLRDRKPEVGNVRPHCVQTPPRRIRLTHLYLGILDGEVCCPRLPHNDFLNDSFLN